MQVKTKTMGVIDVPMENRLELPRGLFGFEKYRDFAIVESEYKPLLWLQSMEEQNLAFLLIDPFLICDDYEVDVDDRTLEQIGITSAADVVVMAIVTVPGDGSPVTANLQGPIIINKKNQQCMQVVLNDSKWTTKHNIIEALKKRGSK